MANCNECKYVSLTEDQQEINNIDYMCDKHDVRVVHRSACSSIFHGFLYPCKQCDGKDFKQR